MKKKLNPELLKEELKKFRLLSEYDFYQEKKELPEYKSDLDEADAPDDATDVDDAADAVAGDLGVDAGGDDSEGGDKGDAETTGDIPEPDADMNDMDDMGEEPMDAEPESAPMPDANEEEVDVTALVKGSEEAKLSADHASHNTEMLMHKLDALEAHVANMDKIGAKIEDLEKEIIKRNPTPVEKLEMRSLDSYPYSQKLTDYWADKEGAYNVMNTEKKPKEYVLTKDDVDNGYSDNNIKKSFEVNDEYDEEEVNGFEEENI